jgi:hypothetical protein
LADTPALGLLQYGGPAALAGPARQFILDSALWEAAADITRYAAVSLCPGGLLLESVAELSTRIHRDFAYVPGFTSVTSPLSVAAHAPTRTTQSPIGPSDQQYRLQNRVERPILHSLELDDTIMDAKLTAEELSWLKKLDTDSPIKPEVPEPIAARLVEQGLAIKLVEGGLQLTTLGREQLAESGGTKGS